MVLTSSGRAHNVSCSFSLSGNASEVVCGYQTFLLSVSEETVSDERFWILIAVFCFLVIFAAYTAGVTVALFSLDVLSLKAILVAGSPKKRSHARAIMPLLRHRHLIMVTLLIANAVASEVMPLVLDKVINEELTLLITVAAVFVGAVVGQAFCTKYSLSVSAYSAPFIWLLTVVHFLAAWPLSLLLDCIFGKEFSSFLKREELKALVELHGKKSPPNENPHLVEPLCPSEVKIIQGALDMYKKRASDAMISLGNVFMMDVNTKLNQNILRKILQEGHSRIPIYEGHRNNILGVLIVKCLIDIDLTSPIPLRDLLGHDAFRDAPAIHEGFPLYDLLNEFKRSKSHISIVYSIEPGTDDPVVVGVITIEDVIEELIQAKIFDGIQRCSEVARRMTPVQLVRLLSMVSFTPNISICASPELTPMDPCLL